MITGFLGSGKTTFIQSFIRLFAGEKILLIINEYGQEGVDGALLAHLNAALHEVSGGSVFCSCRIDQFEKALRSPAAQDADVILVEASGLSDPTGVRRLFTQTGRFQHLDYRGAVCLVDAVRFPKVYATCRACQRQLAASDVAVVNKTDLASDSQMEKTHEILRNQRPDMPVLETSFGQAGAELLDLMDKALHSEEKEMPLIADLTARRLLIRISPEITPESLRRFLDLFLDATFRVKGFVRTADGLYLVDCVGSAVSLQPWREEVHPSKEGFLVALSGAGMPLKTRVREASRCYDEFILSVQ